MKQNKNRDERLPKHNPYQSVLFQIECVRQRTPKEFAEERYIFLSTFYGRKIESGDVRLRDYANMTMADIADELQIRTKMMRAENKRYADRQQQTQQKHQEETINELLQLQALDQNFTVG